MPKRTTAHRQRSKRSRNITGSRIREIRCSLEPKVSQEDLAGRLAARGVALGQTQVARIESGQRPVMDYELDAIAKALRVGVEALFPTRKRN